ncbi:MAG: hypothetical protein ACFE94_15880 [Candidatus Hodarchaeota archaeon]
MENVENLDIKAQKNLDIAEDEKSIYHDSKITFKQELKSAKARELLVKNEIELAKLKQKLAEKSKKLVERKGEVKDILNFSNNNLKSEEDYAIYNEKIAVIKKTIAEVQRQIAYLDKQIAEEELKIIKEKLNVAKEREKLARNQLNYAKLVKISATNEKLTKAENLCIKQQKMLNKAIKNVYRKSVEIRVNEDKLADLKKELSEKLAEREKIRPPTTKFPTNA